MKFLNRKSFNNIKKLKRNFTQKSLKKQKSRKVFKSKENLDFNKNKNLDFNKNKNFMFKTKIPSKKLK